MGLTITRCPLCSMSMPLPFPITVSIDLEKVLALPFLYPSQTGPRPRAFFAWMGRDWRRFERHHPRSSHIGVRFSGFGSIGVAFRAFPPCSFVSSLVKGLLPPILAISPRRTPTRLLGDSYGGLVAMAYAAAHPEHVARLILSDSPGPSGTISFTYCPTSFPISRKRTSRKAQKLGPETEAAARAGLRNHFRMIFYSTQKRDAYMSHMGDLGYEPAIGEAVAKATADLDLAPSLPILNFLRWSSTGAMT